MSTIASRIVKISATISIQMSMWAVSRHKVRLRHPHTQSCKLTTPAGNPFSMLDPDYSSHSTPDPIPTPYQDHTIRPPNSFLAELEWHVAKKSYPKLEDIEDSIFPDAEDQEDQPPRASRFWWRCPCHPDDLEANRSSISKVPPPTVQATIPPSVQTGSIPATPPSGGNVHLPGAFPQDTTPADTYRPSKKRKLNDAATPSFLTGYRIPSPFLYRILVMKRICAFVSDQALDLMQTSTRTL
jgi:hypothetical protein